MELIKNSASYGNQFAHIVGPLGQRVKDIARNYSFSELYEVVALTNVLKCNIQSVYPKIDYRPELEIMNSTFQCASYSNSSTTVSIFWTNTETEEKVRLNNGGYWTPNHFVPLLYSMNYTPDDNSSSLQQNAKSGFVSLCFSLLNRKNLLFLIDTH